MSERASRSLLSVPAGDERKLVKALTSPADELIIDLEDAVPPARKAAALAELCSREFDESSTRLTVRVNAPRTPWCHSELAALAALPTISAVLVPKVESAGDLQFVDRMLDGAEAACDREQPLQVHALIESAAGVAALPTLAGASARLSRLTIGYADLAASLGRRPGAWGYFQDAVLTAARAAGIEAIDGPYLGVDDGPEFVAAVEAALDAGFDGKWVIHPRQLPHVNAAMSPSEQQIEHARRVLQTLEQAHSDGRGAVELDGQMIDEALAVAARRVLAQAGRTS